jgi:hypothetical protein
MFVFTLICLAVVVVAFVCWVGWKFSVLLLGFLLLGLGSINNDLLSFFVGFLMVWVSGGFLLHELSEHNNRIDDIKRSLARQEKLGKYKAGTDASRNDYAIQRAEDYAERARRVRNRANHEKYLAQQEARKARQNSDENDLDAGQLF